MRRCIVTRQTHDKAGLIRFVMSPEGEIVADLKAKLPGRGVWVTAQADYVAKAVRDKSFARAFKTQLRAGDDLPDRIADLLAQACLGYLAMARKAGVAVWGFTKVSAAVKGDVAVLFAACDGAQDGKQKLARQADSAVIRADCFTTAQLSLALGHPNVVHAAVKRHGLADKLVSALHRYQGYIAAG